MVNKIELKENVSLLARRKDFARREAYKLFFETLISFCNRNFLQYNQLVELLVVFHHI
jgi:hypothetical protein